VTIIAEPRSLAWGRDEVFVVACISSGSGS
jgi:hypothetical protein